MAEVEGQQGQEQEQEKPLVALRTVAARMAIALYNEGGAYPHVSDCIHVDSDRLTSRPNHTHTAVARLELVQADAEMYVAGALTLLPYADEDFQVSPSVDARRCDFNTCMHAYVDGRIQALSIRTTGQLLRSDGVGAHRR